jgi:hypothetical protein
MRSLQADSAYCTVGFLLRFVLLGENSMNNNKKETTSLIHLPAQETKKAMPTHLQRRGNLLLIWAWKGTKYFLLTLVGFAIACVFSHTIGTVPLAKTLLSIVVGTWVLRFAASLFCLFALGMIFESWR